MNTDIKNKYNHNESYIYFKERNLLEPQNIFVNFGTLQFGTPKEQPAIRTRELLPTNRNSISERRMEQINPITHKETLMEVEPNRNQIRRPYVSRHNDNPILNSINSVNYSEASIQSFVTKARSFVAAKKYKEAEKVMLAALRIQDIPTIKKTSLYKYLCLIYFLQNDYVKCDSNLEFALKTKNGPRTNDLRNERSSFYLQLCKQFQSSDYSKTEAAARLSLKYEKDESARVKLLVYLSNALYNQKKFQEAQSACQKALKYKVTSAQKIDLHTTLSLAFYKQGYFDLSANAARDGILTLNISQQDIDQFNHILEKIEKITKK